MNDILYKQLFDGLGLYEEKNGKCKLAIFSDTELPSSVSFKQALSEPSVSFVYTNGQIEDEKAAQKVLEQCRKGLDASHSSRGLIWLSDGSPHVLSLSADCTMVSEVFSVPISGTAQNGISVKLKYGTQLKPLESGVLRLGKSSDFSFGELRIQALVYTVQLVLCGENAGTLTAEMALSGSTFDSIFKCGLEYGFTDTEGKIRLISNRLFEKGSIRAADLAVKFEFGFGALSQNRMRFLPAQKPLRLLSGFRTLYGDPIYLSPVLQGEDSAGVSFLPRISHDVSCAPLGVYSVSTTGQEDFALLCGFSGTEYIRLSQNSRFRFIPSQPAFSPFFPEREFSISDFVDPPGKSLLTDTMVTSWVEFYGGYASQPLEAPFFSGAGSVLTLADLQTDFHTGSPAVPLMPYAGIQGLTVETDRNSADENQISGFERIVLANERGSRLNAQAANGKNLRSVRTHTAGVAHNNDSQAVTTAATPAGFIGEVRGEDFEKITLAFSPTGDLAFCDVSEEVRAAFFNASMFCAVANSRHLGSFHQSFSIEDWQFSLSPGEGGSYNDYANILLIKGVKGKIYDPDNPGESLCSNIGQWTCKAFFSKPDKGEYPNLANWITNYCKDAVERSRSGDSHYDVFAQIVTNAQWRGVLALNVTLHTADFPECLQPLLAGVPDMSAIRAHHIGAEIVPLQPTENGPVNQGSSPFFGYIHYEAGGYCGTVMPIQNPSAVYEFRLLEMNVLFDKGSVKEFDSRSQFIMGEFLSQKPSAGGCPYNALLLSGALQNTGGHSVLMLRSDGGELIFNSPPLEKAVVTGITMTTIQPQEMEYSFDVTGYVSFCMPQSGKIDVFSYDSLSFSGYKIHMLRDSFTPDVREMRFDLAASQTRGASLCKTFGLVPFSVRNGEKVTDGFTAMAVEGFSNSELSGLASGIVFSVCLGGLGSLSAGSDLTAKILLAWDGSGHAFAGIQLPGEAMLQNVIGVTFGDVRLTLKDGKLLMYLSKVALELLGLLKLPSSGALQLALTGEDDGIGWYAAYQA